MEDACYWIEILNADGELNYSTENLINLGKTLELYNLMVDYAEPIESPITINLVQRLGSTIKVIQTRYVPSIFENEA